MSFCKAKQSSGERIVATIEFDDLHQNFYQCPPYVKYNLHKIVYSLSYHWICITCMGLWQGPHGRAVAQSLKECVQLDYHLSTTWAQLISVQGFNTFIHTRLLGNKWQYENDLSGVIGVCTEFLWNSVVTTTEWLQLAQQWQMSCCDVIFCWCCYKTLTLF